VKNGGALLLFLGYAAYDVWLLVRGFRTGTMQSGLKYSQRANRDAADGRFEFFAMMNAILLVTLLGAVVAICLQSS
jgi:hypothetical protein